MGGWSDTPFSPLLAYGAARKPIYSRRYKGEIFFLFFDLGVGRLKRNIDFFRKK